MESLSSALSPAQCGQSLTGVGSGKNGRKGSGRSISLKKFWIETEVKEREGVIAGRCISIGLKEGLFPVVFLGWEI